MSRGMSCVAVVGLCVALAGSGYANPILYNGAVKSIAYVEIKKQNGAGFGTGFLVDEQRRLLVTALHVVETENGNTADPISVLFAQTASGKAITDAGYYRANFNQLVVFGKVVYKNKAADLAIVQLDRLPAGLKAIPLASEAPQPGDEIHSIGNSTAFFGGLFNYCSGKVRNVFPFKVDHLNAVMINHHAPTNKGDSGGPLLNNNGQVVGFNALSTNGTVFPQGHIFFEKQMIGFGVSVTEIHKGLQEWKASTGVQHAMAK